MKTLPAVALILAGFSTFSANATRFANQFVEFKLPSKWECTLEGSEWVCQSQDAQKKRDAIIILAAKLRGDQDSLDQYLKYLKKPKTYQSLKGKPVRSEPKYAKTIKLNEHPWIDSLHLESEIPGFYTRYLATIKRDIGVLVTYSINKLKYKEYLGEFEDMVRTLKVFRKTGGLNAAPRDSNIFRAAQPQSLSSDTIFPTTPRTTTTTAKKKSKTGDDDLTFYLLILGLVILVVYVIRKRRGGG